MPPLQLDDEEMNVLLTLAGPIDHQWWPQFLQEVAQVVSNGGGRTPSPCALSRREVHFKVKGDGAERSGLVRPSGRSPPVIDREARRDG